MNSIIWKYKIFIKTWFKIFFGKKLSRVFVLHYLISRKSLSVMTKKYPFFNNMFAGRFILESFSIFGHLNDNLTPSDHHLYVSSRVSFVEWKWVHPEYFTCHAHFSGNGKNIIFFYILWMFVSFLKNYDLQLFCRMLMVYPYIQHTTILSTSTAQICAPCMK